MLTCENPATSYALKVGERTRARSRGASIASMVVSLHEMDEEITQEPLEDHPDADSVIDSNGLGTAGGGGSDSNNQSDDVAPSSLPPMPGTAAPPPPPDYHDDLPPPPSTPAPALEHESLGVGGSSSAVLGRQASMYAGFQGSEGGGGGGGDDVAVDGDSVDALLRKKSVYAGFGGAVLEDGDSDSGGGGGGGGGDPTEGPAMTVAAAGLAAELPTSAGRGSVDERDGNQNHYGELSSASDNDDDYLAIGSKDETRANAVAAAAAAGTGGSGDAEALLHKSFSEPAEVAEALDAAGPLVPARRRRSSASSIGGRKRKTSQRRTRSFKKEAGDAGAGADADADADADVDAVGNQSAFPEKPLAPALPPGDCDDDDAPIRIVDEGEYIDETTVYNPKEMASVAPSIPRRVSSLGEPSVLVDEDERLSVGQGGGGYVVASTHDSDSDEALPPVPAARPGSAHSNHRAPPALPPQSDSESDDSDHEFGGFASTPGGGAVGADVDEDGFQRISSKRSALSAESYHSGFTAVSASTSTPSGFATRSFGSSSSLGSVLGADDEGELLSRKELRELRKLCRTDPDEVQRLLDLFNNELYASAEQRLAAEADELAADEAKARALVERELSYQPGTQRVGGTVEQRVLLHSGWLEKRGGGTSTLGTKKFKRRWFELRRDGVTDQCFLNYYKGENGTLKGEIDLAASTITDHEKKESRFTMTTTFVFRHPKTGEEKTKSRLFHIRAPTKTEKLNWFTVLQPHCKESDLGATQMPLKGGEYETTLSAWLEVHSAMRGSMKKAKYSRTWVELRLGAKSPTCIALLNKADSSRKPSHEIWLETTDVINDASEDGARFSLCSGKLEHSFECHDQGIKDRWLQVIVPMSKLKIMLEKNAARRSSSKLAV